jgi:hypothetical protein
MNVNFLFLLLKFQLPVSACLNRIVCSKSFERFDKTAVVILRVNTRNMKKPWYVQVLRIRVWNTDRDRLQMTELWDTAQSSFVEVDRCFRGGSCLHHWGDSSHHRDNSLSDRLVHDSTLINTVNSNVIS